MTEGNPGWPPWLTLVGLGEDGTDGLTGEARKALAEAGLVVGGRRHLDLAAPLLAGVRTLPWRSPLEDTFPAILARRGRPTVVLASGDPFFFGVGATLSRLIPAAEMHCWPQPSAFSLAAARLGWPLQECSCVSLHGRALGRIVPHLQPGARLIALSWDGTTPAALARLLVARGFGPSRVHIFETMGGPRERRLAAIAATFVEEPIADLNTIAIEVVAGADARVRPLAPGLPDDWFAHDGQITKSPIRAVTLSALAPRRGERLWDVGAGSGSVGIEWLLADPSLTAHAIERDSARAARVAANAETWGVVERLTIVEGGAPAALDGLPQPDAIFIGGGPTEPGLIERCRTALPSGGRLVVNAVTLESQAVLAAAYAAHGGELFTVSVAKAEPVGRFHGLRPAMPVTQWRYRHAGPAL